MKQSVGKTTLVLALVLVMATWAATGSSRPTSEDCAHGEMSCLSCALLCSYITAIEGAQIDVGAVDNGIVVHISADKPAQVVELQRYAYERGKLDDSLDAERLESVCNLCRDRIESLRRARHQLSNSAHGVFTILTSDDPDVVAMLHAVAAEIVLDQDVRGL